VNATLDSEGSERYTFDRDFKQAISSAVEWLVAVFNRALGENKLSEENLEDLIVSKIFQASQFSRIFIDPAQTGNEKWSILRISPLPTVYPVATPSTLPNPEDSVFMPGLSLIDSDFDAKRLSLEKWNENKKNIFEAGNELVTNQLKSYAYLNQSDYSSTGYNVAGPEIQIRPSVAGEFVGITYIKYPTEIVADTDFIQFPKSLTTLIVQKTLNFISIKQGDGTSLFQVTQQDVATLVQLMR